MCLCETPQRRFRMLTAAIITALAGYAIGTIQIIGLDWARARRRHAQELRLLRAELLRARIRESKFGWTVGDVPADDLVPEPPTVTEVFPSTVSRIDFSLTDEFEGDNTQEALLHLLDGLDQLRRYRDGALESVDQAGDGSDPERKRRSVERAYGYARKYDEVLDRVLFHIDSACEDVERRLHEATLRRQLPRVWRELPSGTAPPPIGPGDARLEQWKRERGR